MNQQPAIHHESSGKGTPLVVLHGLFGDADNFRSIALHLERYFRVIRIDLPGHGQSSTLPTLSFENMAAAVQSHLLKVAMQMAGNPSDLQIEKLIVVDIAPRLYPAHHTHIISALANLTLSDLKSRSDADKQLKDTITDAGIRGFLLKSLYRNSDGEFAWRFDLNGIKSDYELIREPPSFTHVVKCPSLFIKGGNSDYLVADDENQIRANFSVPSPVRSLVSGVSPDLICLIGLRQLIL